MVRFFSRLRALHGWEVERKLRKLLLSLGPTISALEIKLRLEQWEVVIARPSACDASSGMYSIFQVPGQKQFLSGDLPQVSLLRHGA